MDFKKYFIKLFCIALFIFAPICVVPNECGSNEIEGEMKAVQCMGKKVRQTKYSAKLFDIFQNTSANKIPQSIFTTGISSHFSPPVSITDLTPAQLLL